MTKPADRRFTWSLVAALLAGAPLAAQTAPPPAPVPASAESRPQGKLLFDLPGLHVQGWEGLDFWAEARWRTEDWVHFANSGQDRRYDFSSLRFRNGYTQELGFTKLGFEWQTVNLFSVEDHATAGPGKNFFDAHHNQAPQSISVRQAWLDLVFDPADRLRVGRQPYEDGAGVKYEDPCFQYVRDRGNARLLGNLDWVGGGRSWDGAVLSHEDKQWLARAFGLRATQGAFEVDHQGRPLDGVSAGGVEVISRRGALVPETELRAFDLFFRDARPIAETKLGDDLFVNALGGQLATRIAFGPGAADLFLWGALENGRSGSSTLRSGAWIGEAGYRFEELPLKPWLRLGHARAHGDGNPSDSANHDFFNGLPTNHTYYGYLDLFALTNMRDTYVDLFLDPTPQLRFAATGHRFAADTGGGRTTFGSGAYNNASLGYGTFATTSRNLGEELDLTVRATTTDKRVYGLIGYSRFWGATAFQRLFADSDVQFVYVEVGFRF